MVSRYPINSAPLLTSKSIGKLYATKLVDLQAMCALI